MKFRSALTFAALAVLGATSAVSYAGDAKTYKLSFQEHWKAGDVFSRTTKEAGSQHMTIKGPDGAVLQDKTDGKTVTTQGVVKALEVDDKGQPTKQLVYLVNWNTEGGDLKDDALSGAHVEVTGVGKARAWKILTPGKTATTAAKAWLDETYGAKEDTGEQLKGVIEPKKEVAVGESWTPDTAELGKVFSEHFAIDVAKSSAKATLDSVEGDMAHVTLEISMHTTEIKSPQGAITWKEGGDMVIKMTFSTSLDDAHLTGTYEAGFELKGAADVQGASLALEITNAGSGESKAGGEIPALPDAK